jgi:hypothetical protein
MRGGTIGPRPGLKKRTLTFSASAVQTSGQVQSAFLSPAGPFQHAHFFDGAGVPCLMTSQGGRQFMIDLSNSGYLVSEITPTVGSNLDINNPTSYIGWSEQAENYWIYQDNQSYPIIFNGATARRSNQQNNEIPVGNIMCYTQGRLSVALPDHYSFRVGDLVFGASGTPALGRRDAMLRFTENNYLNENGDFVARVFGAPSNFGPITSMKAAAMTDTSLGQGPMLIGQAYMVFSVQLPFDRTTWRQLAQAMQTANPINGPTGQDTTVLVNTDMWYRRIDGIGSWITAQRQFNGSWGNTPKSSEVSDVIDSDQQDLLEHGSAVVFGNRLLMTISPVKGQYGVVHRGLVALDFDLTNTIRRQAAPAWEGIWSGPTILKIVKGMVNKTERCFLFVLNSSNQVELWELDPKAQFDNGNLPINWSVDLMSFTCGDYDEFKRLETGRLVIANLVGRVTGTVKYRTDESPCYQTWDTFDKCAAMQDCGPADPCPNTGPHTYREQVRVPIRLKMPPDGFDTIAKRKYRTGYEFQPRIEFSGYCNLRSFRLYSMSMSESLGYDDRNAT